MYMYIRTIFALFCLYWWLYCGFTDQISILQVTTVELRDLPGCSLKTLSQCASLKSLVMNNCNIVALDGLEDCKTLHYIDLNVCKIHTTIY